MFFWSSCRKNWCLRDKLRTNSFTGKSWNISGKGLFVFIQVQTKRISVLPQTPYFPHLGPVTFCHPHWVPFWDNSEYSETCNQSAKEHFSPKLPELLWRVGATFLMVCSCKRKLLWTWWCKYWVINTFAVSNNIGLLLFCQTS